MAFRSPKTPPRMAAMGFWRPQFFSERRVGISEAQHGFSKTQSGSAKSQHGCLREQNGFLKPPI
eukprot:5284940-Lingulodinium_polyedra.AAC.1